MTAQYWVQITDELMAAGPRWPDGMRVSPATPAPAPDVVSEPELPGAGWYLIEDDHAPEALSGCQVELVFSYEHGRVKVRDRRVLP